MSNFLNYAHVYDLLYAEKDYKSEAGYVHSLLEKFAHTKVYEILDIGCGTGKHAYEFAQRGIQVTGIDLSEKMIQIARQNYSHPKTSFMQADARTFSISKEFDAIVSLFHVASYQTTNQSFQEYLLTAYSHLRKGGIFIFDFWYGPAVLTDKPETRVKRLKNQHIQILRIAEPIILYNQNTVDVNYELHITDLLNDKQEIILEKHPMRYWFLPELESFANQQGFKILEAYNWLTDKQLNERTWNGIIILEK